MIKSAYKYLLSSIPKNQNGFNDIIDLRKTEINNYFNNLIAKINELKEKSYLSTNQIEVLQNKWKKFFWN